MRTLAVEYDTAGDRWRVYHQAVGVVATNIYPDALYEGPPSLGQLLSSIRRMGLIPMTYFQKYLRETNVAEKDRNKFELEVFFKTLEVGACYDQVNLPTLASFEIAERRAQLVTHAHRGANQAADWSAAAHFMGIPERQAGTGLMDQSLRKHVVEMEKQEYSLKKEERQAREERALAPGAPKKKKDGTAGDA